MDYCPRSFPVHDGRQNDRQIQRQKAGKTTFKKSGKEAGVEDQYTY